MLYNIYIFQQSKSSINQTKLIYIISELQTLEHYLYTFITRETFFYMAERRTILLLVYFYEM